MRRFLSLAAIACAFCSALPAVADDAPEAGKLVTIEVVIADVPSAALGEEPMTAAALAELERQWGLSGLMRIKLAALENQRAQAQFGGDVPIVQGRTVSGFARGGPAQTTFSTRSVGTLVQATSRVEDGGAVVVNYSIQRSRVEPPRPADDEASQPPPEVGMMTVQSTVRLKPGEPTIVGGRQTAQGDGGSQTWIVLTATVEDAVREARPARGPATGRSQSRGSFAERAEAIAGAARSASRPRPDRGDAQPLTERREAELPADRGDARPARGRGDEAPGVDRADAPPADRGAARPAGAAAHEIKVFQLQNASAANIASVLQQVFASEPVRIAADPRSNSLVVTGAPRTLQTVAPLIQRLDQR